MANYKVVDTEKLEAGLIATANAIREKTGNTEKIDWKENGMADQVDEVFEAGKKSEYDAFWDSYQKNGTRVDYNRAICGEGWNNNTFKPKYPINAKYHTYLFFECINLHDILVPIDFSKSTVSGVSAFAYCINLKKINKIIINESTTFTNWFMQCKSLTSIAIEGTIGQNEFNISWSPLDKASLTSIVNALSLNKTGLTVTLSLDAVNTAFETSPGAVDGSTSEEWLALANTKPNWTISLV